MATSNLPIVKVTATTPGDKKIKLVVYADNLASAEKVITEPIKPDPTPVPPPENIYHSEELLTPRTSGLTLAQFKAIPYLGSAIDPAYGTKMTKITSRAIFNRQKMGHGYSKRQLWNANGEFMNIGLQDILNGESYKYDHKLSQAWYGLWSNTDQNTRWLFTKDRRILKYNPYTRVQTLWFDFKPYNYDNVSMTVGNFEGNISNNDQYVVLFMVKLGVKRAVLFDMQNQVIVWDKSHLELGAAYSFDWMGVSQNGEYIIGAKKDSAGATIHKTSYDLLTGDVVQEDLGRWDHRDCGVDQAGNQVLTGMNKPVMHNMATAVKTDLITQANWTTAFGMSGGGGGHSSCRNIDLPGWACFSVTTATNPKQEVFMAKLDNSHLVRRFGLSYCSSADYDRNAFASPDRIGRRVAVTSDAMDPAGDVNTYIYEFEG